MISGTGTNMTALLKDMANPNHPAEPVLVLSDCPEAKGLKVAKKMGVKSSCVDYKSLRNNEDLPKTIADELGLDIAQLMEDMQSKEIIDLIDWEYNQLSSLRNAYPETEEYASGVRIAVPKFFINGREPIGRGIEQFSTMIDEELERRRNDPRYDYSCDDDDFEEK